MKQVVAVERWFTKTETGMDKRTGARALIASRARGPSDRGGFSPTVWDWEVLCLCADGVFRHCTVGTRTTQGAARSAVRAVIRLLPDKDKT